MTPTQFTEKLKIINEQLPGAIPYDYTYKLTVKKKDEHKTLLEFYAHKFQRQPQEYWSTIISQGKLLVNGKPQKTNYNLKAGETTSRTVTNITEPNVSTDIKLIYCDSDIVVIDKPSPLPTQASGRFIKNTLHYFLESIFNETKIYPIHRLDANTTGIIIMAFNPKSAQSLIHQFQKKTILKTYLAIVEGKFIKNTTIKKSISKEKETSGSRKITTGENSSTHIEILNQNENQSFLKLNPETGRTNQIRLHLASLGHPIIGDIGYKNKTYFKNNPLTYPKDQLFLHAWKINIQHPSSKKQITFESTIPKKFNKKNIL